MISGKPVTVQMAGGGSKTLTFVQQQPGKILRLPTATNVTTAGTSEQPKLVVVPRQKQPSTIASTSFDSPATTDAALAALAAEAGLIDPEPNKDSLGDTIIEEDESETPSTENENDKEDMSMDTQVSAAAGLFGGSSTYSKLCLKGGAKFRLGLFGGSPVVKSKNFPPKKITYRGGLMGGSKDSPEASQDSAISTDHSQTNMNGSFRTIKSEDGCDNDESKLTADQDTNKTDSAFNSDSGKSLLNTSDDTDTNMITDCDKLKNEETSDDALSALASAALDHSKDNCKTDKTTAGHKDPKDTWYTVGFIKGTSCDVRNYFLLDEDSSNYVEDSLPDTNHLPRINLDPGTAYKFRVAALNSVGRGEWSEVISITILLSNYLSYTCIILRWPLLKRVCQDFQVLHQQFELQKLSKGHICLGNHRVQARAIFLSILYILQFAVLQR